MKGGVMIKHLELSVLSTKDWVDAFSHQTPMINKMKDAIYDDAYFKDFGDTYLFEEKEAEAFALELSKALQPQLNFLACEYMDMLVRGDRIYFFGISIGVQGSEDNGEADPLSWGKFL